MQGGLGVRARGDLRPRLFDRRLVREAAERSLTLSIADLRITVRSVDPALRLAVDPPLDAFLIPPGVSDLELSARFGEGPDPSAPAERLFDSGSLWQLFRHGDGRL